MIFKSEYDAEDAAEGSIDPLGLSVLNERLAEFVAPGIRQRHRRPRFLTALCFGRRVTAGFGPDEIATDQKSEPWQVYEWFVVDGLVRAFKDSDPDQIAGLPGQTKAVAAMRANTVLSAARYLQTPSVFGFHGVYKNLARALGLVDDDSLLPDGERLLEIWEKEQRLQGKVGSDSEAMRAWRRSVQDGLKRAEAKSPLAKGNWEFAAAHLAPYQAGPEETDALWSLLDRVSTGHRQELLRFVVSGRGRREWDDASGREDERAGEAAVYRALEETASSELRMRTTAILAYERFSRLLATAFDAALWLAGEAPASIDQFAKDEPVVLAAKETPRAAERALDSLRPLRLDTTFTDSFGWALDAATPAEWFNQLLAHHGRVQRDKPPAGKLEWFDQISDRYLTRASFRREERPSMDLDRFEGLYRVASLRSMAFDLKRITA
jgi:hypothetical protein